ncbi:MAG: tetratricopeptide repeat protein [Pseudomonadota bacterium]
MRKFNVFASTAVLMTMAGAASAEEIGYPKDALGFEAMVDGNWRQAERQLEESAAEFGNDPARLLNLAQVYRVTGREAEARGLYRRVLESEDMVLVLSDGRKVSAHTIAGDRLATVQSAGR